MIVVSELTEEIVDRVLRDPQERGMLEAHTLLLDAEPATGSPQPERLARRPGSARGPIHPADDFDAPLEELEDYM